VVFGWAQNESASLPYLPPQRPRLNAARTSRRTAPSRLFGVSPPVWISSIGLWPSKWIVDAGPSTPSIFSVPSSVIEPSASKVPLYSLVTNGLAK
jgi:hypothetical protein